MAVSTDMPPTRGEKQDEIVRDEIEDQKDGHDTQTSPSGDSGGFTLKLGVVIFVSPLLTKANDSTHGR